MFSKKPAPSEWAPPARTATNVASGSTFSVFGADIAIKGDVVATAELHVDGRIEGDIACTTLVQGGPSEILGAVTAESARLAGTVRGSITAGELVILKTARIEGDVFYDALTIEQGAVVDGRLAQRSSSAPSLVVPNDDSEPRLTLAG